MSERYEAQITAVAAPHWLQTLLFPGVSCRRKAQVTSKFVTWGLPIFSEKAPKRNPPRFLAVFADQFYLRSVSGR
jgi:hypothetical protein